MQQHELWQDGFSVLQNEDTGEIGKRRLRRFLYWLDESGIDWTKPDLEAYAHYLRTTCDLTDSSVDLNLQALRNHYLAILSNPENYAFVPPDRQPGFVNSILEHLGFNTASVRYTYLIDDDDAIISENMQIVLPDNAYVHRETYLTTFVHWLDETGREWFQPDLLRYKWRLREQGETAVTVKNTLHLIRKRYQEMIEDDALMATLTPEQRKEFREDFRRRLGYMDSYPSMANATRDILEDDPYNKNWLRPSQERELMEQPDATTLTGARDRAMFALVLTTGIQQFELAEVQVDHLRRSYEGECALYVPESTLRDERCIPYDGAYPVLEWIDTWLEMADITEGAVFRGTYGNTNVLRPHSILPETARDILARYPITIHGNQVSLFMSDLRGTCGRRWYTAGESLDEIERRFSLNRDAVLRLIGLRIKPLYT